MSDQRMTIVLTRPQARWLKESHDTKELALWNSTFNIVWPEGMEP